ncbi:hypothetical protein ANN_18428 [Periplaneta americana]|uniref:Reverse transcriptase domain-containing protein n=1 Tax=Periplaneta americana TaxID=6978 RepID=A0ABQ8SNQ7_PERAM|nr:hypothetical protein ANN_18428 [Periplaneta americana]
MHNSTTCQRCLKLYLYRMQRVQGFRDVDLQILVDLIFIFHTTASTENFEKHKILSKNQFGFRNNISTDDALFNVTGKIINELDIGNKCLGIFLDLRKAFDTINHNLLLDKLHTIELEHYIFVNLATMYTVSTITSREQRKQTTVKPWFYEPTHATCEILGTLRTNPDYTRDSENAGEMTPGSSTESYPAFARIGLKENLGKNLNQVTCPDRDSNPGHLVSLPDTLTVTLQVWTRPMILNIRPTATNSHCTCERVYMYNTYIKGRRSCAKTRRKFRIKFPNRTVPSAKTIRRLAKRLKETGSVKNRKSSRKRSVLMRNDIISLFPTRSRHCSRSPDITPCDFYLWGTLKVLHNSERSITSFYFELHRFSCHATREFNLNFPSSTYR